MESPHEGQDSNDAGRDYATGETSPYEPGIELGSLSPLGTVVAQIGGVVWVLVFSVLLMGLRGYAVWFWEVFRELGMGEAWAEVSYVAGRSSCGEGPDSSGDPPEGLGITVGVVAAWWLAVSYRVGYLLAGHCQGPSRLVLRLPGIDGLVVVPAGASFRWFLWIVLVVLLGLLHPAEACSLKHLATSSTGDVAVGQCQALVSSSNALDFVGQVSGIRVWVLLVEWVVVVVAVVVTWEVLKRVCCRRRTFQTAASQTEASGIIPMPLEGGVPNRARILFCLWQSGYAIVIEAYPTSVQEEYFGLLGGYLRTEREDGFLSD